MLEMAVEEARVRQENNFKVEPNLNDSSNIQRKSTI